MKKRIRVENYILFALGIFAIVLGILLLQGTRFTIPEETWLIGGSLNTKIFSWILIGLGIVSIPLVLIDYLSINKKK